MFKVYFGDGSTFSSKDGLACDIEQGNHGVAVIAQVDKLHGWHTVSGHTYYYYDDKGQGHKWFGGDFAGLILYLMRPGPKRVLIGEEIENETFNEISRLANNDPDFPRKTGYGATERQPE